MLRVELINNHEVVVLLVRLFYVAAYLNRKTKNTRLMASFSGQPE